MIDDASAVPTGLAAQFRRHLRPYALGVALLAIYQVLAYLFDRGIWWAVDAATAGQARRAVLLGVSLVFVALVSAVVRVGSRVFIFNGGRDVEYELRKALLTKLHALGPSFYRKMPTGEIMSRATNDSTQVRLLLGFGVLNLANTVFALASALAITLSISTKLTLASLAPLPLLMLITRKFSRAMFQMTRSNQAALGKMSDRVQASLAGVRVIKSFALEEAEARGFDEVNQEYLKHNLGLAKLRGSMMPITQTLGAVGLLIVFLYGGRLVLSHEISPGAFVAFFWAVQRLTWPLMALGFVFAIVQRGRAGYARLRDIYDAVPDVVDGPDEAPSSIEGALEVRSLSYAYSQGGPLVLDGVSFSVPARGSLAIVGRTGSGKSTLASLLPRLLPTPEASVFLDGRDVCRLPLATVRHAIGFAQQDAFLFSTTVARNVGFSLDDVDSAAGMARVEAAAADAEVLDEVRGLPEGFDTVVGERGVQLSGGQRQRVALARALVWEPPILVLDDPISAVDTRTEKAILDTIDEQAARRTVLLITHRVAAAARCDSIVVMDGGRVVDRGTHDELLASGGLYARFAEEQRIEGELDVAEGAAGTLADAAVSA